MIDFPISILTGEIIRCTKLFKDLPLKIGDCVFPSNLKEFNLGDLDIILGMNKAKIECEAQKVLLRIPLRKLTSYRHFAKPKNFRVFYAIQVKKLLKKGRELFFCSVQDVSKEVGLTIEDNLMVNVFMDVFSSEISVSHPQERLSSP